MNHLGFTVMILLVILAQSIARAWGIM